MHQMQMLIKQLRELPYVDMLVLANALAKELDRGPSEGGWPQTIATALVSLDLKLSPSGESQQEEKILREIFRVRRSLGIAKQGPGWMIECSSLNGSQVVGANLRPLWSTMLDQIVTLHIMKKT